MQLASLPLVTSEYQQQVHYQQQSEYQQQCQTQECITFCCQPPRRKRVNLYRHAELSEEVTYGEVQGSLFANFQTLYQLFSGDMLNCENLAADMLVKAGIMSDADASAALSAGFDEGSVIEYFRIITQANPHACDAFNILVGLVRVCRISFHQAVVAANHLYTTGASVEESLSLVNYKLFEPW